MRSIERWEPTKFVTDKGGLLAASSDTKELDVGSWLAGHVVARTYGELLPEYARGRLIDLGCGKVPLYDAYRLFVTSVTCVDWANSRVPNVHLDLEHDLNQPLPLPDASFDTIILSDVLEHIAKPEMLWREMNRVLASGGKVILNVPFYYKLHAQPFDFYRYTEFALRRLAEDHNFRVLFLQPTGGSPEVLTDIVSKHFVYIPLIGKSLAWLFQRLTYVFVRSPLGRKISRKTGEHFPFGYFLVAEKL